MPVNQNDIQNEEQERDTEVTNPLQQNNGYVQPPDPPAFGGKRRKTKKHFKKRSIRKRSIKKRKGRKH